MRYFLIIMAFCVGLMAGEMFSIQVISVEKEASLTKHFMKKVKSTDLSFVEEDIQGEHRIYLGKFTTRESAMKALMEVRQKVSSDAFICERGGEILSAPKLQMQKAMVMAQARTLKKMKEDTPKTEVKELQGTELIAFDSTKKKILIERKDTKVIVAMKGEVKMEEIYCTDTRQALRQSQIQEAVSFYKNSSYYNFNGKRD